MTDLEDDHASTLSGNIELPRFTARSASMSMSPSFAIEERTSEIGPVSGPLSRSNAVTLDDSFYGGDVMSNKSLQMAGPSGLCNDPDQIESPAAYKTQKSLGRRRLEMQLRRRDVERWMSHRRLPKALKRKVRQAERFTWAATRGINEEQLLENLPEDIQREIHRHFFGFLNKVRIFSLMDEPMLGAIYKKLKQKLYIKGSDIFYKGGPVEKMVFIVSGKLESIGADGNIAPLAEGDVCGEELLTWYLEHTSVNREGGRIQFPGSRSLSIRTVTCLTNVEAFALHAADLEEVTTLFSQFLRNPRGQGAIKSELPYWRKMPVTRCQVAWRYRQKRLKRASITNNLSANHTARR